METGDFRAPVFQHHAQPASGHRRRGVLRIDVGQAEALFGGGDHQRHFADRQRAIDLDFQSLAATGELPAMETAVGEADAHARVLRQFARAARCAVRRQVGG